MNLILRACFKIINNYKILICNLEISPERVSLNKCEPDPETRSINHLGVMEWGGDEASGSKGHTRYYTKSLWR